MQKDMFSEMTKADAMQDIDFTGWTLNALGKHHDKERDAMELSLVYYAWYCGKIFTHAKRGCQHGQWLNWLKDRDVSARTAQQRMQIYNGYSHITMLDKYNSVDSAVKALQGANTQSLRISDEPESQPEPQPEQPKEQPGGGALKDGKTPPSPDPATREPRTATDITTGEETTWPEDKHPSVSEQIQTHDNAPKAVQDVKLTKQDVLKNQPNTEPRKPQVKTMQRNMRFSKEQNGTEVLENLYLTDYVVINARDLWRLVKGFPLQGVNGEQVVFQKGEVLR